MPKHPRRGDSGQDDRDGLAVHIRKRGGGAVTARANWKTNPDRDLEHLAKLMSDKAVSRGVPYELRELANVYDKWEAPAEAIRSDARRLLKRKRPGNTSSIEEIAAEIELRITDAESLRNLANRLLIAKAINSARGFRNG
jgi:hypothetical protein